MVSLGTCFQLLAAMKSCDAYLAAEGRSEPILPLLWRSPPPKDWLAHTPARNLSEAAGA